MDANEKTITLRELYQLTNHARTTICAMSAFNGKILCKKFDPKKHPDLADREVISVWPSLKICKGIFGDSAQPVIECYLQGSPEYNKTFGRPADENT